jgi:hypothetical protein
MAARRALAICLAAAAAAANNAPAPSPPSLTLKIGVYDYFIDESSPVIFNGALLMFESVVRGSPSWAGNWLPAFAACDSYFRVRDMRTLAVIVNMTATCNHAFGAALVFRPAGARADTLLVTGTPWARANALRGAWSGPCAAGDNCTVDFFWSSDAALADASWRAAAPGVRTPGIGVYNNDVVAVPPSAGLPWAWAMALETTAERARFAVSSAADPTDVSAWALLNDTFTVPPGGDVGSCPSLRHDGAAFYYLTGGSNIQILRSRDLVAWEESPRHVLRHNDSGDCVVAPAWFGAPTGYVPTGRAAELLAACGAEGNFGDDSDVDLIEWPEPFGATGGPPAVLLQYGSGDQRTFGFSNLALFNGTMIAFLQSFFA